MFSILLPVHRNSSLLPYSVESVLSQTFTAFELLIICDGAPEDTIECANQFSKKDHRVRVFSFPKGERHGEAYRHKVSQQAYGHLFALISDDDLWLPNHLEEMFILLQQVDFGNVLHVEINPDQSIMGRPGNLKDSALVDNMLSTKFNFFGITAAGYTLSAYNSLSDGWSPAPQGLQTDLYMWRKFLSLRHLKFGTRMAVTSLHFPASSRHHFSEQERKNEIQHWATEIQSANKRDQIAQDVLMNMNQAAFLSYQHAQSANHAIKILHETEVALLQKNNEISEIKNEINEVKKELNRLLQSRSWKMTRFLRLLKKRLRFS